MKRTFAPGPALRVEAVAEGGAVVTAVAEGNGYVTHADYLTGTKKPAQTLGCDKMAQTLGW